MTLMSLPVDSIGQKRKFQADAATSLSLSQLSLERSLDDFEIQITGLRSANKQGYN